jgi:hypothetical protein
MRVIVWSSLALIAACGGAPKPAVQGPEPAAACDATQGAISRAADARAAPYGLAAHLAKNFVDGEVAWLMKDESYQTYVVATSATRWGRCNDTGCYLFAAPSAIIRAAVEASMEGGAHDPTALGQASACRRPTSRARCG